MRPLSHSQPRPRCSSRVSPVDFPDVRWFPIGSTCSTIVVGIHICAVAAGTMPPKLAGAIPTIE
jgi:hypothetical protein